jgi:hypothetical protein
LHGCWEWRRNNRVDRRRLPGYDWNVRSALQLRRRLSQALVWVAAVMLPLETGWPTSCGCGMSGRTTASSKTAKSHDGGCCHKQKACACCRTADKSEGTCCKARGAGVASHGCQCGTSCQCAQPRDSAPAVPSPNNGPTGKELSCQFAAAAVMPEAIQPACFSLQGREVCSPTVVTSLELCSTLGRFLL